MSKGSKLTIILVKRSVYELEKSRESSTLTRTASKEREAHSKSWRRVLRAMLCKPETPELLKPWPTLFSPELQPLRDSSTIPEKLKIPPFRAPRTVGSPSPPAPRTRRSPKRSPRRPPPPDSPPPTRPASCMRQCALSAARPVSPAGAARRAAARRRLPCSRALSCSGSLGMSGSGSSLKRTPQKLFEDDVRRHEEAVYELDGSRPLRSFPQVLVRPVNGTATVANYRRVRQSSSTMSAQLCFYKELYGNSKQLEDVCLS